MKYLLILQKMMHQWVMRSVATLGIMMVFGILSACHPVSLVEIIPCVCTKEFKASAVTILDNQDSMQSQMGGVTVTVTVVPTQKVLKTFVTRATTTADFADKQSNPTSYVIVDDSMKKYLSRNTTPVQVTLSKGERQATFDYVYGFDGACACHIQYVSGPSEISLP